MRHFLPRLLLNKFITASVVILTILTATLFMGSKVFAVSQTYPDPGTAGMNDAIAVVSRTGGAYTLNAVESFFKIFVPTTTGSATANITVRDFCNNYRWGDSTARILWWPNNSNEGAIDNDTSTSFTDPQGSYHTSSCSGSNDISFNVVGGQESAIPGHTGYATFTVAVQHAGTGGGINGFRVHVANAGGFVTFREQGAFGGATSAGTFPTYNAFAVLDEVFSANPTGEDSYTFSFGTDCRLTTPTATFLRWSDADFGRSNEVGNVISWTLYDDTAGTVVGTLSGSALSPSGLNDERVEWGFTAEPNHKYRWVWNNVDNINGVQVWIPYNEVNYLLNCPSAPPPPPPVGSCSPAATGAGGTPGCTVNFTGYTGNSYPTFGTQRQCYSVITSNNGNGTFDSASCGGGTFRSTSTTSMAQGTIRYYYETRTCTTGDMDGDGLLDRDIFGNLIPYCGPWSPAGSTTETRQIQPCKYTYWPNNSLTPNTTTRPKPSELLTVNARLVNSSSGQAGGGPNYQICIKPIQGLEYLDNSAAPEVLGSGCTSLAPDALCQGPGIPSGGSASHSVSWRLADDTIARHGEQICFEISHSPASGGSTPTITIDNPLITHTYCVTIYNMQYNLSEVNFTAIPYAYPGDSLPVTPFVTNAGPVPPAAMAGPSYRTTLTASVGPYGSLSTTSWGPQTIPYSSTSSYSPTTLTISPSAPVGTTICVTFVAQTKQGYSDGGTDGAGNGPRGSISSASFAVTCTKVINGPYIRGFGNAMWAGGGYDTSGTGTCTLGNGDIEGNIRRSTGGALNGNWVGSANQFSLFARASVTAFASGTSVHGSASAPFGRVMTFSNETSPLGNFGATRCIAGIFDGGGGVGGAIDDRLWNNANDELASNINSWPSGQYRVSAGGSAYEINLSGNTAERITVLVDGDVLIRNNIIYSSSWGTEADPVIPAMVIISTGNIYISDNVRRIDAVLMSQFRIDTCTTLTPTPITPLHINNCNRTLEVNGAFIADEIVFRRTAGGVNGPATGHPVQTAYCRYGIGAGAAYTPISPGVPFESNLGTSWDLRCAAEVFRFSPMYYLANPILDRGEPPDLDIKQLRDLPPLF